jgi:hypothetical protein
VQGVETGVCEKPFPKVTIGLKLRRTLEAAMKELHHRLGPPSLFGWADEVIR